MISIIIPNYNHARYLKQRIDSVISQTYQDYEVIIMDDCSLDKSKDIIEQYRSNSRISHIIYNEKNSGSAFKQWKKGIELAKGDWIWIAESDDYCDNTLLETLVNNSKQRENTVISYCQSYFREEGNDDLKDMSFHTDSLSISQWKNDYFNYGLDEIINFLLYKNTIPNASAVLFKKSAYANASKEFEEMKMCGDWMLWVQLLKSGNIAFCSKPLNNFRAHSATTRVLDSSAKKQLRLEEEFLIALNIQKAFKRVLGKSINKRMRSILYQYNAELEANNTAKLIISPSLYKGKIPYTTLMIHKIKHKLGI